MNNNETKDTYSHVLKYTGIFGGVQGLNIIVGIVRNKLVALLLGPGGMGLVALFNSVVTFISQATSLGISFSAVRNVSMMQTEGEARRLERFIRVVRAWSLVAALGGMLVCMLLGPLLSEKSFSWGDHTLHFLLLSPVVGMTAITGGETAILKGARRLHDLAVIQLLSVMASLVVSVPMYYFFGLSGIIPVFLLMALSVMLATVFFSYRLYPLRLRGSKGVLGEGMEMIRLGVAFIMSGILTNGAEMLIRSFLNVSAGPDMVGLYNAGYVLTITYAGMVFSAMETDYYPRLSAVCQDTAAANLAANRQIEVSMLIISPMLAFLVMALPLLVPLLYSGKFVAVVPMARVAVLSMYLKAATLPVAYMTLARGHSGAFFLLDGTYAAVFFLLVVFGFNTWGLFGTGVALLAAHVFDLLMIYAYAYLRYGYRVSRSVLTIMAVQAPLGAATWLATLVPGLWTGLLLSLCAVAASAFVSIYILYKKTSLWNKLKEKIPFRRQHP